MLIRGKCHCGNIAFSLTWDPDPIEIAVRACTCSFCVKHGGVWTSHPGCALRVVIQDRALVSKYAFGTQTADFHVCVRCGVVPVVTSRIDGRLYAVVSVNTFESVDPALLRRTSSNLDGEEIESRIARRERNWIADVEIEDAEPAPAPRGVGFAEPFVRPRVTLTLRERAVRVGAPIPVELALVNPSNEERRLATGFRMTNANGEPAFEVTFPDGQTFQSYGEQATPIERFVHYDPIVVPANDTQFLGRWNLDAMTFIEERRASGNPRGYQPFWKLAMPGIYFIRWWDGVFQLRAPLYSNMAQLEVLP